MDGLWFCFFFQCSLLKFSLTSKLMSQCTYEIQLKRKKNVAALAVNSQVEVRENGFNTRLTHQHNLSGPSFIERRDLWKKSAISESERWQ